ADQGDGRHVRQASVCGDVAEVPVDGAVRPGGVATDTIGAVPIVADAEGRLVGQGIDFLPELDGDLGGGRAVGETGDRDVLVGPIELQGRTGQAGGRRGRRSDVQRDAPAAAPVGGDGEIAGRGVGAQHQTLDGGQTCAVPRPTCAAVRGDENTG